MLQRLPFGLAAGLALAGLAAGLASCQETEDTSQLPTGSPTASASAAPSPGAGTSSASRPATVPPGYTLFRWVNVTVLIPIGSGITAGPSAVPYEGRIRGFDIVKVDPQDSRIASNVVLDAKDGAILEDNILEQHRTEIRAVLATLQVSPFVPALAPWPYNAEPAPELVRESEGGISWIRPSPATGLYVGWGLGDPGGFFVDFRNERSAAFASLDEATGALAFDTSAVVAEDLPVFERWLATVKQCSTEIAC